MNKLINIYLFNFLISQLFIGEVFHGYLDRSRSLCKAVPRLLNNFQQQVQNTMLIITKYDFHLFSKLAVNSLVEKCEF